VFERLKKVVSTFEKMMFQRSFQGGVFTTLKMENVLHLLQVSAVQVLTVFQR